MKMNEQEIHYQDMPKPIQDLVDGTESLVNVFQVVDNGQVSYKFVFEEGLDTWARFYDAQGNQIRQTPYLPKEGSF